MNPVTPTTTVPARVAVAPALLVAAILLLALNMRGPIVAVSPVTETIRADLGVDGGTVGLLTSLPLLTGPERRQPLEWNDTRTAFPGGETCLHRLIEAQAGRIWIEAPSSGRGTTVAITLAAALGPADAEPPMLVALSASQ